MSAPAVDKVLSHKHLISDGLWQRLVVRVERSHRFDRALAETVVDQTLGFLRLVAIEPDGKYSPAPLVDHGWHAFLQYTREYAEFGERVAGRFIHHSPLDEPGQTYPANSITRTLLAMQVHGLALDPSVWQGLDGDCAGHKCYTCVE